MDRTNETVIQTEHLSKIYKSRKNPKLALDDLNLTVNRGEIFGYLGPNGAGKSTTIRMLLDLIHPTKGQVTILGLDAQKDSVELHKRIGYLPGELRLWQGERGSFVARYFARVRGGADMTYLHELADRLQLDLSLRVRDYSSGNRRKLGLVLALMNKPELLILDEPTNGLDPLMQQIFNQLMLEIRAEGRTVFLSSHLLGEVQAICDRVGILRDGQLKAVETVEGLTHTNFRWVTVQFRDPAQIESRVSVIPGVSDVKCEDNRIHLRYVGDFDPLLRAIGEHYVVNLEVKEPTLEEIFLTYYDGMNSNQHYQAHEAEKEKVAL